MARDLSVAVWPDLFRPQQMSVTIDRPLFKGPKPLSGREQVVASDAGGWLISYDGVPVYGAYFNAWRSLWMRVAAKGLPVYVKPDFITTPTAESLTTFSDTTLFQHETEVYSGRFSDSDWTAGAGLTTATDTAPDGTSTAEALTDPNGASVSVKEASVTISADTLRRGFRTYVKKAAAAPSVFATIYIGFSNGSILWYNSVTIDPFSGTTYYVADGSLGNPSITVMSVGSFWRVEISGLNQGSGYTSMKLGVGPAATTSGTPTSWSGAQTGTLTFAWPSVVEYPTNATASFSQGTGDCALAAAAALGATTIFVVNSRVSPRVVGDWFELNGRVHVIEEMSDARWSIWPPLRDDYASGTVLEIDDPRVLAYLTPDSRGNVLPTDARQLSLVSLEFIEASW